MTPQEKIKQITDLIDNLMTESNKALLYKDVNLLREYLHRKITKSPAPVDFVRWIPIEKVTPNDYNPNTVATKELRLLYTSIKEDGYTQPIVTIYDEQRDMYVIVDGFHRYFTMKSNADLQELYGRHLPCVVIEKEINQRMASTVRHNRARGHHSVDGMSNLVFQMLNNGWSDDVICNKLGLEIDELLRLKHITGFSKLFEDVEYSKAWKTDKQLKIEADYKNNPENQ